jgi:hypothetical protein
MRLLKGWRLGLRRCEWIVKHFAKLDMVDRKYVLERLAADNAKMSANKKIERKIGRHRQKRH